MRQSLVSIAFLLLTAVAHCTGQSLTKVNQEKTLSYLRHLLSKESADKETQVVLASIPLNPKEHNEVFAYVSGPFWCGSGGCVLIILDQRGDRFELIGQTTITRCPIRVLATETKNYPDLGVLVSGGGILHAYEARLRFDGKHYPSNPTVFPSIKAAPSALGKTLISAQARGVSLY